MTDSPLAVVLGDQADQLSRLIRHLHAGPPTRSFRGSVTVTVGAGLGRLAAKIAGFPPPMQNAPFHLDIVPTRHGECWTRRFGDTTTVSYLKASNGKLLERFGPITTRLVPQVEDGHLRFTTAEAWTSVVPLPRWLAPDGQVFVQETNERYHFDITGDLPIAGRAIRYQGWLAPTHLEPQACLLQTLENSKQGV